MRQIYDAIRFLILRYQEPYAVYCRILGFCPRDIQLYQQASTHRSITSREKYGRLLNNERLEFLGDAILDAMVADILYRKFPHKHEGFLTNTRSKIVQREMLNHIGREIGLGEIVATANNRQSHNSYLLGNALEALIGAVYLDRGYLGCMRFVEQKIIRPYINLNSLVATEVNFKSKLIEWSQRHKVIVDFMLTDESVDRRYNPVFTTHVCIEKMDLSQGVGYSKKESQQKAAMEALRVIELSPEVVDSIKQARAQRIAK